MHKFIAISAYVSASILASAAMQVRGMLPGGADGLGTTMSAPIIGP
jgi:hypothetical protein